jgi:hypothetical protein
MMLSMKTLAIAFLSVASASLDVKRWTPPLPSCTPYTPFVYVGCFQDPSTPSALIYRATTLSNTNMTVGVCVDFCKGMCSSLVRFGLSTNRVKAMGIDMLDLSITANAFVELQ